MKQLFTYLIPFKLKDYSKYDIDSRSIWWFEEKNMDDSLADFVSLIKSKLDKRIHFPIIRVADGEYQFLFGKNEFNLRKPIFHLIRDISIQLVRRLKPGFIYEARSRTYTSGRYSLREVSKDAVVNYERALKETSECGVVTVYTVVKPEFYIEQYIPRFETFLAKSDIELTSRNCFPFYFVYIILTNPEYNFIYSNKRIHLITSFDVNRMKKIENTLQSRGAISITWTKISPDKSLYDQIDTTMIPSCDIVFIGAGLGKTNIFNQLKGIDCLIVDAGYIFEIWEDNKLNKERDYCVPH